jgi:hypothetical protein
VLAERLRAHAGTRMVERTGAALIHPERQLSVTGAQRMAVNFQETTSGVALHLSVYDYDERADHSCPSDLDLVVGLPFTPGSATLIRPGMPDVAPAVQSGDEGTHVDLGGVVGYAIVAFEP